MRGHLFRLWYRFALSFSSSQFLDCLDTRSFNHSQNLSGPLESLQTVQNGCPSQSPSDLRTSPWPAMTFTYPRFWLLTWPFHVSKKSLHENQGLFRPPQNLFVAFHCPSIVSENIIFGPQGHLRPPQNVWLAQYSFKSHQDLSGLSGGPFYTF